MRAWFQTRQDRRALHVKWDSVERGWVFFPDPRGPRPNAAELANAGVPTNAWADYQHLRGSAPLTSRRVAILYQAGLTPALCQRWLDRQDVPGRAESAWHSVTVLAVEVEAMLDNGVPPALAGLYALARYDANEAAAAHRSGAVSAETLQVQVQLAT